MNKGNRTKKEKRITTFKTSQRSTISALSLGTLEIKLQVKNEIFIAIKSREIQN